MNLLNPFLLLGVFLAAVPIIIHILNRSKYRIEPFGAMMFVRRSLKIRAQKIKVQQLILMILRALFFVLLALALARPVLVPRYGLGDDRATTHVLIFDGSFSMQRGGKGATAFDMAKESALRVVDRMQRGDNMLIIVAGSKPRALLSKPSFDKVALRSQIKGLQAGAGSMNVPRALDQAFWLLEKSTLPRHRIYLLTDGQQTGWQTQQAAAWQRVGKHREVLKIQPAVYTLSQCPSNVQENLALLRIFAQSPVIDTFRPTKFTVQVANYGTQERNIRVKFSVDGKFRSERELLLKPGGVASGHFDHLFQVPGSHYVSAEIADDDLSVDNVLYHAVNVMKKIPILIVEGKSSSDIWKSDGKLLKLALEATGEPGRDGLFEVTLRNQSVMDTLDSTYLKGYKAVVLADVASLSDFFMFEIEKFVKQGGGLLISLGDQVVESEYQRIFQDHPGILPARLKREISFVDEVCHPTFSAGNTSPMLDVFDLQKAKILNQVVVRKYWRCAPGEDAFVLGKFNTDPFLVFHPYGEGGVLLWTTSINNQWTNFPVTPDFLPLVQNLVLCLSANVSPPINLDSGDLLVYRWNQPITGAEGPPVSIAGNDPQCMLTTPDGKKHQIKFKRENQELTMEWNDTLISGLYSVTPPELPPRHFTVNPNPGESDLRELETSEEKGIQDGVPIEFVDNEIKLKSLIQTETGIREWWRTIIYACLILLAVELLLGWRFSG